MAAKQFVILRHECSESYKPGVHWDLMLEEAESLRTWALGAEPVAGRTIVAEQLPDHRSAYLDYEGPISGNRGVVSRWDSGTYELMDSTPDEWRFLLRGGRLSGRATLARNPDGAESWWFILAPLPNGSHESIERRA